MSYRWNFLHGVAFAIVLVSIFTLFPYIGNSSATWEQTLNNTCSPRVYLPYYSNTLNTPDGHIACAPTNGTYTSSEIVFVATPGAKPYDGVALVGLVVLFTVSLFYLFWGLRNYPASNRLQPKME